MADKKSRKMAKTIGLSVDEACELCSFGRSTFYKYLKLGKIPAHKLGARTIVVPGALKKAIKALPPAGGAS